MIQIQVLPLNSLHGIQLGWTSAEVYANQGPPQRIIDRIAYYQDENLHISVHFDESDQVEFIEIARPESSHIQVLLHQLDIFHTEATTLIDRLQQTLNCAYDPKDPEIPYAFTFPEVSLGLWRPTLPEDDRDADGKYFASLGIGIKGYYA